jgi:hypothetical protein
MSKLRKVKPDQATLTLVWADPASLDENCLNWKTHPDFQTEVVGDLIRRHGWIKPLVYNEISSRLIDGHDRRKIAIADGMPAVPVIVGRWPEEDEAEILATLDPSGALAKGDPARLDAVMRQMQTSSEAVAKMVAQLAKSEGVLDWLERNKPATPTPQFTADPQGGEHGEGREPTPAPTSVGDPAQPPAAAVRTVYLFLRHEDYPEFREMADRLAGYFGTDHDTDTVLAAIRDAYEACIVDPAPAGDG